MEENIFLVEIKLCPAVVAHSQGIERELHTLYWTTTLWYRVYDEKQKNTNIIFVDKSKLFRQSSRKTRERALNSASVKYLREIKTN